MKKDKLPRGLFEDMDQLVADMFYQLDLICDDFADAQGKPTETIDKYLDK
jgi:hypothetical protein